ncbi:folylpolyglutamate synthase, partial [Stenotrophomonas sp. DDT-1]
AAGIAAARIPGRLQAFERGGVQIRVDVGHNPQAAGQLARALKAEASAGRTLAVYAALQDKDAVGVVQALQGVVAEWTLAGVDGPRGQSADQLQARLAETAAGSAQLAASVEQALAQVLARAERGDRVLVFGSFHTAAAALQWLQGSA